MHVDAKEFLTDDQKHQLGAALFEKLLAHIETIEFVKNKKVNLNGMIEQELENMFENGEVYEQINFKAVGKKLTAKILGEI